MKLATLLLVIGLVHIGSVGYGQITLKEKNAPLEKVLAAIEKQTKYVFLYDPDDLKMGPVTISIKNAALQAILEKLFTGAPVEFTIINNNVLLKKKRFATAEPISDIRIHGQVVDSARQALAGVTVLNERERKGTVTDTSGSYTLRAVKGDLLRFSSVAYKDREIRIGDQSLINVSLAINPSIPDQVVVIGYGSSKRKDVTGAITVVEIQDLGEVPYNTIDNALAGKAAGVDVTKTDGTPGGMVRVRIRGASSFLGGNDPLYVIDGVPLQVRSNYIAPGFRVSSPAASLSGVNGQLGQPAALSASFVNSLNSLGGLNPEDIESITILKDASSTAIYGSKGSNGVVIITTKKGEASLSPTLEVNYSVTANSPYKTLRLLNASQYKSLIREAAQNALQQDSLAGNASYPYPVTAAVLDSPTYFGSANTNWIRQVTRRTLSNQVGISLGGGKETSKYFSSINYATTPGVLDGTDYQRISGKFNVETQLNSKLRFAANLLAASTNQDVGAGTYAQALLARPDLAPREASGAYTNFDLQQGAVQEDYYGLINPAALATATNNSKTFNLLGSLSASYAFSPDLTLKSTVSLNMQNYNQRNYLPGYIDVDIPSVNDMYSGGVSSEGNSRFADWFVENTLTYIRRFNEKHAVNVVVGQSFESTKYSYFTATGAGYPNGNNTNLSSADTMVNIAGDEPTAPQSYLLSFYARTNYSYLDKYLFTFTGRADGSSKFGTDNKFGYFPSAALAWRISREAFLKKVEWIDDLKLRGSYGVTGNQNIGDLANRTFYSLVTYASNSGLIPTMLGNEQIKWESTREADIGLDLSLRPFGLYATFDYYNRQTRNAIFTIPIVQNSAYSTLLKNAAGLRNRGFEISIGGDIVHTGNFKWTASINATWNRSLVTKINADADYTQITSLSGFENIGNYQSPSTVLYGNTALLQGKPLGLITGYQVTGLIRTQAQLDAYTKQVGSNQYEPFHLGDPMYQLDSSTASQGYELAAYNITLANGAPKYFGGMTQEFSYKHFGLRCFFTFSHGGHLLWAAHAASDEFYGTSNASVSMLDRYTPVNTNSNAPRLNINDRFHYPSSLDIFSSSYVKLRSVTLSYHFRPSLWMKTAKVHDAQLFVAATNVFTFTKYPGGDPETSDDGYSIAGGYIDASNYPAVKTFSFGLKAVF